MDDRIGYFKRVTAIHDEAVRRLIDNKNISLDELASFFEDVGRFYLDISEDIRTKTISPSAREVHHLVPQSIFPSSQKECLVADIGD